MLERGAIAGRGARGRSTASSRSPRRVSAGSRRCRSLVGVALGVAFVRRQTDAGRPADRPEAVPRTGFQRVAGHVHARRSSWLFGIFLFIRSTSSSWPGCRRFKPGCGRCPPPSRSSSARCWRPRRAPGSARHTDGSRAGGRRYRLARDHQVERRLRTRRPRDRDVHHLARSRAGLHAGHRPDHRTAPPERAGAASAISETGAELGGALWIALSARSERRSTAARSSTTCQRECHRSGGNGARHARRRGGGGRRASATTCD